MARLDAIIERCVDTYRAGRSRNEFSPSVTDVEATPMIDAPVRVDAPLRADAAANR